MSLLLIEEAILTRAQELIQPLRMKAEAYPDRPENHPLTHPVGDLLVVYRGSTYGPAGSTDLMVQPRDLDFELGIRVRSLRNHTGAYLVIEALRAGFAGWMAPGADRAARLVRDGFQDYAEGEWQFLVVLRIPTTSVPAPPTEETFGVLRDTTILQEFP